MAVSEQRASSSLPPPRHKAKCNLSSRPHPEPADITYSAVYIYSESVCVVISGKVNALCRQKLSVSLDTHDGEFPVRW